MKTSDNVYQKGLCIGCGLCSSLNADVIKMSLDDVGFYKPIATQPINVEEYCPGVKIDAQLAITTDLEKVWGPVHSAKTGFATNSEIRHTASSGGGITGFVYYLLKSGFVDGIIHVGVDPENPMYNKVGVSNEFKQLVQKSGSRYAPVPTLINVKQILDSSDEKYAFVGKPCDVAGISNFLTLYPEYVERIKIKISFFCAGMPSMNGTKSVLNKLQVGHNLTSLKYRGNGWPGSFTATDTTGKTGSMSYNDSWGKILGRTIHLRCKICPDGIGMLSDVTFADGWEEKDGYPSFEEKPGESLIILRNAFASDLLDNAVKAGYMGLNDQNYNLEQLRSIQKYQWQRRIVVGSRIASYVLLEAFKPSFKGLYILSNTFRSNPIVIMKNVIGFIKRQRKHKRQQITVFK